MLQLTGEGAEGQPRRPVPLATALWALAVCDAQQLQHANYPPADKTLEVNILIIVKKATVKGKLSWEKKRRAALTATALVGHLRQGPLGTATAAKETSLLAARDQRYELSQNRLLLPGSQAAHRITTGGALP